MDFTQITQRISDKFAASGHQIDSTKIDEKLSRLIQEFGVPPEEAERIVISEYSRDFGLDITPSVTDISGDEPEVTPIAAIKPKEISTIVAVVTALFPSKSPSIAQSGILADQTGTVRFTVWVNSNAPVVEAGSWYRFEHAAIDEYNDQISLKVETGTSIIPLEPAVIPIPPLTGIVNLTAGAVTIEGKIVSLSERADGPIHLAGVIADGTGAVRFTIRRGESETRMEEGSWYRLTNATADHYRGAVTLQINAGTRIEPINDDRSLRPSIIPVAQVKPGVVCLRVKVVQEYESSSERMFQSGILGDESGTIRFVTWKDDSAQRLNPGMVYTLYYVSADEFNSRLSLTINGATILPDDPSAINIQSYDNNRSGVRIDIEGVVTTLFPPRSQSIAQSGILADNNGAIRFTVWANAGAPTLTAGNWYRFESVVKDEYNGQPGYKINAQTRITPLTGDQIPLQATAPIAELKRGVVSLEGKVVSLTRRSEGSVRMTGVIADETGAIRFTIREGEPISGIQEGGWYRFDRAIADVYRGAINLQINTGTRVEPIGEERNISPVITTVSEIKPGIVSLRVKVVQEYDSTSDRMLQSGILGDETGTIRFVTWKDETAKRLTPGTVYTITYASADEYNGRPSLTLTGAVFTADETGDIEVRSSQDEVIGALVHISPGSGLIKRCPIEGCGRVLTRQNYCQVHEIQPNYQYDLRIKGWMDNGNQTWDTIISREGVENLLGLTLDVAREMAENNPLGLETVYYHLCEQALGRYLVCRGRIVENRLFSSSCSFLSFDPARHADLLNRTGGDQS